MIVIVGGKQGLIDQFSFAVTGEKIIDIADIPYRNTCARFQFGFFREGIREIGLCGEEFIFPGSVLLLFIRAAERSAGLIIQIGTGLIYTCGLSVGIVNVGCPVLT